VSRSYTRSVKRVLLMIPPITTVARGRCTSAPTPLLKAIGRKPRLATRAVMSTGRRRVRAASSTACSSGIPCAISRRMKYRLARNCAYMGIEAEIPSSSGVTLTRQKLVYTVDNEELSTAI
jgi:hypothetical protein